MPTVFRSAPMSSGSPACSFAMTVCIPLFMFMPWSASPIAASRAVRYSLFSATASAKAPTHRTTSSCPTLTHHLPPEEVGDVVPASLCLSSSRAPAEPGRPHGRVPQCCEFVVELHERDRTALRPERRDVGADQLAADRDPALLQEFGQLVEHDVELDQRRAAHPVHEREHLVAARERKVLDDRRGHQPHDLADGSDLQALAARLPVDPDADLHLVV